MSSFLPNKKTKDDKDKNSLMVENFISLFTNMAKKIVTILISIFIVLSLFVRSYVPGEALYPHTSTRFPYVKACDFQKVRFELKNKSMSNNKAIRKLSRYSQC